MSEYRAAVCEDEKKIMDYLVFCLDKNFRESEFPLQIDGFLSGKDLLKSISLGQKYNILFLDIEMPELNGIDLCRKIRQFNKDVLIIFISNKEELVFQTFEVQPFRFVRKNHFKEELPQLIADIIREFQNRNGSIITIQEQYSNNIYSLDINSIIYVEVLGKYCDIVTSERRITLRHTISELEDQLVPFGFLRPHRSYLVNFRYIYSIASHSVILDDQTEIPLSKKRDTAIKEQFIALLQNEL